MKRDFRLGIAVLLLVPALALGADVKDDSFATPIKSAGAFLDAGVKQNADVMLAHALDGKEQTALVKWILAVDKAGKALHQAAIKKFGADGADLWPSPRGAESLDGLKAIEDGDKAVIAIPKTGSNSASKMRLKKVDGKWKVDATSIPHPSTKDLQDAMVKALEQTTADLTSADAPTLDALTASLQHRLIPSEIAMSTEDDSLVPAATQSTTSRPPSAAAATPATKPGVTALDAGDIEAITKAEGQTCVVTGVITEIAWSATGKVLNISFKGSEKDFKVSSLVKYKAYMNAAFGGDITASLAGKTIQVTGKIQKYEGMEEILVDKPTQIVVVKTP